MRNLFALAGVAVVSLALVSCSSNLPATGGEGCAAPLATCGSACVDTSTDPANCGACATACEQGQVCSAGVCSVSCLRGTLVCAGGCVDPLTNNAHCGATADCAGANGGTACAPGTLCSNGVCAANCAAGQLACGGTCVDPKTSNTFCGATGDCAGANAGKACPAGTLCSNGKCETNCAAGQVACSGRCVDPANSNTFCGATADCAGANAGKACPAGTLCSNGACETNCAAGQLACGGTCVDPKTSNTFCGATGDCAGANAGKSCPPGTLCSNGACATNCAAGQIDCGGRCVDPNENNTFCGATGDCTGTNAGTACPAGQLCTTGRCAPACAANQVACGGVCIDPATSNSFCGATGDCTAGNAGTVCPAGQVCSLGSCAPDCAATEVQCGGKCVDPKTSRTFCGASGDCTAANAGATCAAGTVCTNGACQVTCATSQVECGGTCIDPATNNAFCGASQGCTGATAGTACAAGTICTNGTCAPNCAASQVECSGTCIDPKTSNAFCGASSDCTGANSGKACAPGTVCTNGACATSCAADQVACNGSCIDPKSSNAFCGATGDCSGPNAGAVCPAGKVCTNGLCATTCAAAQVQCGGTCIDPKTSNTSCGASGDCTGANAGVACAPGTLCTNGACATNCAANQVACNGSCIDPKTSNAFCGATSPCTGTSAGKVCAAGTTCQNGSCVASCAAGQIACNNVCIDPMTNPTYCGASGSCTGSSAGTTCASGQICSAGSCGTFPVPSCRRLHVTFPSLPSGTYSIDPDGLGPKPSTQVYCDMTTDGGGYTWVKVTDAALAMDQAAYVSKCASLGMEIVVPRTRAHAVAMAAQLGGALPNIYNVYPNANGLQGIWNWHGSCQGANCTFWMTDDTSSNGTGAGSVNCTGFEPNGDNNTANAIYRFDPTGACASSVAPGVPGQWNDANNQMGITGSVVCSTNDYGPANGEAFTNAAASCKAIHAAYPTLGSGKYWIDPDGPAAGDAPFLTFCDMTTDGGGWTAVYKVAAGANVDANALWNSAAPSNGTGASSQCADTTTLGATAFCVNSFVTKFWNANGAAFSAARVHAFNAGAPATLRAFMRFDVAADKVGWFSKASLVGSSWTDIASGTQNYFSIAGETPIGRNFFINQVYAGCPSDIGWFVVDSVGTTGRPCSWDQAHGTLTRILFSKTGTATNWNNLTNVSEADIMMVLVR